MNIPMTAEEVFFYSHGTSDEEGDEQRREHARELARAERWAKHYGHTFDWGGYGERSEVPDDLDEVESVSIEEGVDPRRAGRRPRELGRVDDVELPTDPYQRHRIMRLVEAELAMEAMEEHEDEYPFVETEHEGNPSPKVAELLAWNPRSGT